MTSRNLRDTDTYPSNAKIRKPKGRMIRVTISDSTRFANLSPNAMILFTLLIPHYDDYGKMRGDTYFIKGDVVPFIDFFDLSTIESCLREIALKTAVKWFAANGRHYLQALHFDQHQDLRPDRRRPDSLPEFEHSKHLPENAWLSAGNPPQLAGNPPQLAGKMRETPSSSTSPSTSTSELPSNILTTTTRARATETAESEQFPLKKGGQGVVLSFPLTSAALAEIIPDVDDDAVHALITACRAQQATATDAEIAHALERKFHRAKQLKTRNLVGFLLVAVPKVFIGEGYKNLQRSLAHASQTGFEGHLRLSDDEYCQCAVEQLQLFVAGKAPRATAETWLPYLEARLSAGDVPAHDWSRLNSLCADARDLLPVKAVLAKAARGP